MANASAIEVLAEILKKSRKAEELAHQLRTCLTEITVACHENSSGGGLYKAMQKAGVVTNDAKNVAQGLEEARAEASRALTIAEVGVEVMAQAASGLMEMATEKPRR